MAQRVGSQWVRFGASDSCSESAGAARTLYGVSALRGARGPGIAGLEVGQAFVRLESSDGLPAGSGDLVGVSQHLGYTESAEQTELRALSATAGGAIAVLIPLSKSAAWWALPQDERRKVLFGREGASGHYAIGREYASRIVRRLYHARYLPGSNWDFLTYFEFDAERRVDFEALLAALRDPKRNPEWSYVEREAEIWLEKS